jgi:triosephosphate isomerase (TIM)
MHAERTPMLAANWKANQGWEDCERFVTQLKARLPLYFEEDSDTELDAVVFPPYPYLTLLGGLLSEANLFVGAQDVSRFAGGAYTGEVTGKMLSDTGCDYAIVGHSERRHQMGETDAIVAQKLLRLREVELTPLLCVGEPLAEREAGRALSYTLGQLDAVAAELKQHEPDALILAYEPVWAIGTGKNAQPADAEEMALALRKWLKDKLGREHALRCPILYGGSVKPENIASYVAIEDIDGALIGGASLKADSYAALIKAVEKVLAG